MAIRPSTRQRRSEANRKLLLHSALDLFSKYGYDAVTVDDIANNVGLSKGSFYNLFRSKGDLIIYRSEVLGEAVKEKFMEQIHDPEYRSKDAVAKVRGLIEIMIETSTSSSNRAFLSQMFISVMNDPPEDARNYYEQHQTDDIVRNIILDGQSAGEIRADISCDEILRSIHVFQRGLLLEWCYKLGKYDIVERNRDTIAIFCRGIAAPRTERTGREPGRLGNSDGQYAHRYPAGGADLSGIRPGGHAGDCLSQKAASDGSVP